MQGLRLRAAAVALAVLAGALAGCTGGALGRAAQPGPTGSGTPPAVAYHGPTSFPADPAKLPKVPAHGAYLGAWSRPTTFTDSGIVSRFEDFQSSIGRELDIFHTYHTWEDPFFSSSDVEFLRRGQLVLLSWAGTDTRSIISGAHDQLIRQRARDVKAIGKPFFMEWRWEMDRPNLQASVWSPQDYVAAWLHIRKIFDEEGARNAAWVWCPLADGFADGRAPAYYPGDAAVDWICVDAYPGPDFASMQDELAPFLAWAAHHDKPIMIGEYAVPRDRSEEERAAWLAAAQRTFAAHPRIKAVVYFDSSPAGESPHSQYALAQDPAALTTFADMAADPYFNPDRRRLRKPTG